nr:MAG TPA: hypothetical protein [Caudoviricetes sp.]
MKQILQTIIYMALAFAACAYIGCLLGFTAAISYHSFRFFF